MNPVLGALILALLAGVAVLGYLAAAVLAQRGQLILRIDELEQAVVSGDHAPAAAISASGLPVGTALPDFVLPTLHGGRMTLSQWRGRTLLLLFFDPDSPHCASLAPVLTALPPSPNLDQPLLLIISRGDTERNRRFAQDNGIRHRVLLEQGTEVARLYETPGAPAAYLVDPEGRTASPLALGPRAVLELAGIRRDSRPAPLETDTSRGAVPDEPKVLILTPVKDAAHEVDAYCERVASLTYPHDRISLGFLESDSTDGTYRAIADRLPVLQSRFRRAGLWKRDFGYQLPHGIHRGAEPIQAERRTVLARSRNHLLSHALNDEDWVLWLDVDVVDFPPDLLQRLLGTERDIVQPHCVLDWGGPTFDTNGWRDHGRLHLDDLRGEGDLVPLDAVGGTVLLVRADLHRDGLVFPAFPYGQPNPLARPGRGELETEGLGILARAMGYQAWGMPNLEVRHRDERLPPRV